MRTDKPTPAQILAGGETIETRAAGTVFVRQVKPTEVIRYLQAEAEGEEAVLTLVCRREDGQPFALDDLSIDEYEAALEVDRRQNFTAARKREAREADRAARQMAALREQNPDAYAQLVKKQSEVMGSMFSSLVPSQPDAGAGSNAPTA